MANIAVVTADLTHAAYTVTKPMLESKGHTVTGFTSAAAVAATLATFDIVLSVRGSQIAAQSAVIKAAHDLGVPVLVGMAAGAFSESNIDTPVAACKIAPVEAIFATDGTSVYASAASSVYTGLVVTIPSTVAVNATASHRAGVPRWNTSMGDIVALRSAALQNFASIFFASKGSLAYDGTAFPDNIGFCGFLYGGNGNYTAAGATIIDNMITKLVSGGFILSGSVKDGADLPLARKVRAYNRATGRLVSETTSAADTGNFSITVWSAEEHTMIAYDATGGDENALIADRVIPASA